MITHALVIPQSINTLSTWCGIGRGDPRADTSNLAFAPEAVTCPHCQYNMRQALKNLMEWVPRLKEVEEDRPGSTPEPPKAALGGDPDGRME